MNAIILLVALTVLLSVRLSYSCSPSPSGAFEQSLKDVFDRSKIVWKLSVISTHSGNDGSGYPYFSGLTMYYCEVKRLYKGCRRDIKSRRVWLALSSFCSGTKIASSPLLMMIPNGTSLDTLNPPGDNFGRIAEHRMGENGNAKVTQKKRFWSHSKSFKSSVSVDLLSSLLTDSLSPTPSPSATSCPTPVKKKNIVKAYFLSIFDYHSSFSSLQKRDKKFWSVHCRTPNPPC